MGRVKTYESIVKGENVPVPGIPESFKVLVKEIRSLALDIEPMHDADEDASAPVTAEETSALDDLAALAGVLLGMYYGVINPYLGFMAGLKAFTAAVLGGIGSIPGAVLGGLLLGVVEALTAGYLSTEYKDVMAFVLLIGVLLFMPTGILGRPEVEKV